MCPAAHSPVGAYLANALLRDAMKMGAVESIGHTVVTEIEVANGPRHRGADQ